MLDIRQALLPRYGFDSRIATRSFAGLVPHFSKRGGDLRELPFMRVSHFFELLLGSLDLPLSCRPSLVSLRFRQGNTPPQRDRVFLRSRSRELRTGCSRLFFFQAHQSSFCASPTEAGL